MPSPNQFICINPTTGASFATHHLMTQEEADATVRKCHAAFESWRNVPAGRRAETIRAIGGVLRKHKERLAALMTQEMGKLLSQAEQEVELCAAICDYTADQGPKQLVDENRALSDGGRGIISYRPTGVIYGIQPWNFPCYQVIRYSIASLMAGNGVLLKHARICTGTAKLLAELYAEAGLPDDLFGVLVIDHDQSDAIIGHELVRGVTLTGSPAAGRHVAAKAGEALKKTVMELGANDAYVVLADADLEAAVDICVQGRIYNNGEVCIAAKRFIVVDEIYDAFERKFGVRMSDINLGDPTDRNTNLGPMAREDLRKDLHDQVTESIKLGARLIVGGEIPDGAGFFYPATVLADVAPGMPAYDDELFGPVASLIRAKDTDDAMRIANDSRFGLGGGIISQDEQKAIALARDHFDTGMVFINGFGLAEPNMPFGGVKDSGYGREHGGFGVREFVNVKSIVVPDSDS